MKNSILQKINSWKVDNKLTTQSLYKPLLKAYRRVMMFKQGDFSSNLVLLAYPSEVKFVRKYLIPCNKELPRAINWYKLTEEGKAVLENLNKSIGWNTKEMNDYFFKL